MKGEKKKETVLIVEDDTSLAQGLKMNLSYEGYEVLVATDGETGLALALNRRPDLIVLDLMLPQLSGLEVLEALRDEELEMQILILSALGQEGDKVRGLQLGADDYMTKPFGLKEFLARVDSALRRPRKERAARREVSIEFGEVVVWPERLVVEKRGAPVHLTAKEFSFLLELVEHPERPFTRDMLLKNVWGYDYEGTERTVDNFMRSLRRKLERRPKRPKHLVTVHGVGYMFKP